LEELKLSFPNDKSNCPCQL
jgi:hypothetical protein